MHKVRRLKTESASVKEMVQRPAIRNRFLRLLFICAALYVAACLGCASFQRRLIYFPQVYSTEQVDQLARGQNMERWKTPEGESLGWKRAAPRQPAQGGVL